MIIRITLFVTLLAFLVSCSVVSEDESVGKKSTVWMSDWFDSEWGATQTTLTLNGKGKAITRVKVKESSGSYEEELRYEIVDATIILIDDRGRKIAEGTFQSLKGQRVLLLDDGTKEVVMNLK